MDSFGWLLLYPILIYVIGVALPSSCSTA